MNQTESELICRPGGRTETIMIFRKCSGLRGQVTVPGDKSISHRGIMLGSIAKGTTRIHNFLQGADCLSTISCFRAMGIPITIQGSTVQVEGLSLIHI